jgi:hypothetical protein
MLARAIAGSGEPSATIGHSHDCRSPSPQLLDQRVSVVSQPGVSVLFAGRAGSGFAFFAGIRISLARPFHSRDRRALSPFRSPALEGLDHIKQTGHVILQQTGRVILQSPLPPKIERSVNTDLKSRANHNIPSRPPP